MNDLATLLCGGDLQDGIAKVALSQLGSSINSFSERAIGFLANAQNEDLIHFGPFCARVLLENGCAALIGRLDSFRMLYLCEFQNQPQYEYGKRAKSAFAWSGDVIPDEKQDRADLWNVDNEILKIGRSLFSKHFEHIYWKPAVERMLDFLPTASSDHLIDELLSIEADTFIGESKGRSMQLYSTLSKGVHWEFFTSTLVFDELTTKGAIRDACVLTSKLGLVSHFIPTAYASLEHQAALNKYLSFRRRLP